ncbi:hypothetical protein EYB26_002029 [Talaromyces marneffei]|uniref:uncharacterized protein n=1 Tax=Talaromyces marneffei TaxID=37727 RepID=UPI0012A9A44E|nr:uncharacterized protein EYB26_002029 [Talaromyces marneffei]QGA14376.1 hypothetical protein EYB26_002029 [Talaromyces marneffei]
MDDFEELSMLHYARSQAIARNHQQFDPLDLLGQTRVSKKAQYLSSMKSTSQLLGFESSGSANITSIFTSINEKLVLDKDGVNFLTAVLQEVTSLQRKPDQRAEDAISLKLKYKFRDDLKINVPLLSTEKENMLRTLSKRTDPVELLNEIAPNLADRERANIDEGLEFPDYFWELPSILDRDPSMEKLEAPKGTRHVLLEAMTFLDEKRHRKDTDAFVEISILDIESFPHLPTPPLYIESEDQHQHNIRWESHPGSDFDTGHDSEVLTGNVTPGLLEGDDSHAEETTPYFEIEEKDEFNLMADTHSGSTTNTGLLNEVVEDIVTPGLHKENYQPVGDPPPNIESEQQHERNIISASRLSSDTDTGHFIESIVEHIATPRPFKVDNPLVGDVVPSKRIASPLALDEANEVAEISTSSGTLLSPVTDSLTPFAGSLGTLSAFMQTRCHKNKRRKLDHESQYFSNTPKKSTKTGPDKLDTPAKTTEPIKVLSSPIAIHDIQNVNLYPKYPLKEGSSTPLILIISTQLLRSDSTLIRSLEDLSTSRYVRLFFRDYQGAKSSQPQVVNEADLIVSSTTGIILSSSHETTQKYLPGQGLPGIESPLHARIVQSAPRYEILYVLVRSPIETTMNTLSSLRDLTTYCMSLNHVCDIKVLLIATDHVLEWILSIAAKHIIDSHLASSLNTTEGEITASHFHDDQTQWEVFLRKAGLNPFAAQSVLAMLKTSSARPGRSKDVSRESALSRFVEMPYQTRRHMFQEIVGQRVLSRVGRVLEIDWQVDWAVDLARTKFE